MTLQKAQEIKMICDEINKIEQKIKELEDCSYIEVKIIKNPFYEEIEDPFKIYRSSRAYEHLIQAYKEDRDALIRELNNM